MPSNSHVLDVSDSLRLPILSKDILYLSKMGQSKRPYDGGPWPFNDTQNIRSRRHQP